jgi:hypothetical protein
MQDQFGEYKTPSKKSMLVHNKLFYSKASELLQNSVNLEANFIGGELFHRADMKELYEGFDDTIETLDKLDCFRTNVSQISSSTNLLYKDLSLLEHFIKGFIDRKLSLGMLLSFDL